MTRKGFVLTPQDTCRVDPTVSHRHIYFLDICGKDPRQDVNRWRIHAFYKPAYAETLFFYTEEEYKEFIKKYNPLCYQDFTEYRHHHDPIYRYWEMKDKHNESEA